MDRQPILDGERVWLRPLKRSDWDALWGIAQDKQIWAMHPAHDRWQEPVFREFFDDALAQGGGMAVVDKASPEKHELAKRAKDMGSAAVLLSLIFAACVWGLVLVPFGS